LEERKKKNKERRRGRKARLEKIKGKKYLVDSPQT
jgi:hypothetical protein